MHITSTLPLHTLIHTPSLADKYVRNARWHTRVSCLVSVCVLFTAGCGYTQGQMLYFLGFGQAKLAKAQFELTDQPIVILVDDPQEMVRQPSARQQLVDSLGEELIRQKAAHKIVPRLTIENLRLTDPKFNRYSAREIGEQAGATQMIWLTVSDYRVSEIFDDPSSAAIFQVQVKVLNVLEKKKGSRVRLWPMSPAGQPVRVQLHGSDVVRLKKPQAIGQELAATLAQDIAKLFYDHRLSDFGS